MGNKHKHKINPNQSNTRERELIAGICAAKPVRDILGFTQPKIHSPIKWCHEGVFNSVCEPRCSESNCER